MKATNPEELNLLKPLAKRLTAKSSSSKIDMAISGIS
jgi:hypothetical protein